MLFKRNKKRDPQAAAGEPKQLDAAADREAAAEAEPTVGPFDADHAPDRSGYVDLGALLIEPVEGMQLRLEVEDKSKRVIAVALELDGSRLQLQVFAAPKSDELWPGISQQIEQSIASQGGKTNRVQGRFGEEVIAKVPSTAPDGTPGYMVARFIGIDGPRWFLRGVVGGPATLDRAAAERLEERLSRVVVVRGDKPMPPAELLPLTVPAGAVARPDVSVPGGPGNDGGAPPSADGQRPPLQRPERGPEITEIG